MIKKFYIQLLLALKALVSFYDASVLSSAINRAFDFFSRKCSHSLSSLLFTGRGGFFENSISKRLISLPFDLVRGFYIKHAARIEGIKGKSSFLKFLESLPDFSVRSLGFAVLVFGVGTIASSVIFNTQNMTASSLLILAGILMAINPSSLRNTLSSGRVCRFALRLFLTEPPCFSDRIYDFQNKIPVFACALALGIICGFGSLVFMLGVIAVLCAVVLILYRPAAGVFIFVAASPFLPTMLLAGIVVFTFVSYILSLAFSRNAAYSTTPFSILIAAFLFVALVSSINSANPSSSIAVFMIYAVFTLAFTVMANTIRTRAQWRSLLGVFAVCAFIVAAYGVFQNFFIVQTDKTWVDSEMFEDIKTRVYSTFGNPNVLGQFLILSLPVTLACTLCSKRISVRLIYLAFALTGVACLFFTWSRAAWVGVMLATVIMLVKKDRRFVAVCIAGLVLLPFVMPDAMLSRLTSIGNTADTSTSYRIAVWTASVNMIRDFPLTGVGLGSDAFALVYRNYALGGASFALHAHNFYLQWILDMGIGGLVIYIAIILTAFRGICKTDKKDPLTRLAGYAIAGSLIGYLFQGMAETMWYTYRMVLLFWIFMGLIQTSEAKGASADD